MKDGGNAFRGQWLKSFPQVCFGLQVALVAALGIAMASSDVRYLAGMLHDDAFFYIKTANNFAAGLGATFDGINPTNGFHPLYFFFLALIARVQPLTGSSGVATVFVTDCALTTVGLFFIDKILRRYSLPSLARFTVGITVVGVLGLVDFGMEGRLLLPLVAGFLYSCSIWPSPLRGQMLVLSIQGAAIVLTRLELLSLVGLVFAIYFGVRTAAKGRYVEGFAQVAKLMVLPVVALSSVAYVNWLNFGHISTVSGWLKTGVRAVSFGTWVQHLNFGTGFRMVVTLVGSLGGIALAISVERQRRTKTLSEVAEISWLLVAMLIFNLFYLFAMYKFSRAVGSWYFVAPLAAVLVGIPILIHQKMKVLSGCRMQVVRLSAVTLCLAVLLVSAKVATRKVTSDRRAHDIEMGEWIANHLPMKTRIFMVDNTGFLGYFSERAVINGDGLINSFEYQEYLRSGRLREFVLARNVEYMLLDEYSAGDRLDLRIPMWRDDVTVVWHFDRNIEPIHVVGKFALFKVGRSDIAASTLNPLVVVAQTPKIGTAER